MNMLPTHRNRIVGPTGVLLRVVQLPRKKEERRMGELLSKPIPLWALLG